MGAEFSSGLMLLLLATHSSLLSDKRQRGSSGGSLAPLSLWRVRAHASEFKLYLCKPERMQGK